MTEEERRARVSPITCASLAATLARRRLGMAIAAMMPMMATTMSSSMRVNPFFPTVFPSLGLKKRRRVAHATLLLLLLLLEEERRTVGRARNQLAVLGDIDGTRGGSHEAPHTAEALVRRSRVVAVVDLAVRITPGRIDGGRSSHRHPLASVA